MLKKPKMKRENHCFFSILKCVRLYKAMYPRRSVAPKIIRDPVKKRGELKTKASFPRENTLDHTAYMAIVKAMDIGDPIG